MRGLVAMVILLARGQEAIAAEVSVGADGKAEESNPYQEGGDTSTECYTWAADGQCKMNPEHMLSSCKYSCWEWWAPPCHEICTPVQF